jgi:hypothetical protein
MFRTATSQASTPRVIAIRIWICFGKIFAPRKSSWDFTIRGVSNLEKLMLTISGEGTIARLADNGKDVSRFFTNSGHRMGPIQRVNWTNWTTQQKN